MKFKLSKSNWPRLVMQWGVILFVAILAILGALNFYTPDFEAYCPVGGIQAFGSYLINNSLTCSMTSTQIVMGLAVMIGVFIFSKLFCSFICPIGTVSEWLGKIGDKLKIRISISGIFDKLLRSLKYILLFVTFYYTFDSSELFCKKFDPYYAITTGFSMDVAVLWASIAIFLVIIGSVFIRLFWCKYLCPFSALSNLFKFTGFFVLLMLLYFVLLYFGIELSYVWPLAIGCIGGYIIEISRFKTRFFPIAKITRNENSCTDCQLCSKKCPQGIDVANAIVVRDVDCNLCSDCVVVCPVKDTLQINKSNKLKWLAPIATIILIVVSLYVSSFFEVPTIDQKWYSPSEMENAEVFTRSGLKSMKCYGSSTAFANQMRKVKGVMGVSTFVGTHTVKIYFDPNQITEKQLEEAIFVPSKTAIRPITKDDLVLNEVTIQLDKFFDAYDFNYLSQHLKQETTAVGLVTEYGCPVIVHIYFLPSDEIDESELTEILEAKTLTYPTKDGSKTVDLKYVVIGDYTYDTISIREYLNMLFKPYVQSFNGKNNFSEEVIKTYQTPMGKNQAFANKLTYLVSHLSNNEGIVELRTLLDSEFNQMVEVSYIDTMTNANEVYNLLISDTLYFTYRDGNTGKVLNMFDFKKTEKPKEKD